jgi:hypothetical protein
MACRHERDDSNLTLQTPEFLFQCDVLVSDKTDALPGGLRSSARFDLVEKPTPTIRLPPIRLPKVATVVLGFSPPMGPL